MPITPQEIQQLKQEKKSLQPSTDYALDTVKNIPSSAYKFAGDTIAPLLSPIETAKNLFELGKGVYNLYTPGEQPSEETARAVGKFYFDRYGGKDFNEVKQKTANTIKEDPIGALADLAIPLSIARVPLKSSNIVSKATKAIDPTELAIKGTSSLVKGIPVASKILGGYIKANSGLGDGVLSTLYKAGRDGGEVLNAVRAQMNTSKTMETALKPVYSYLEGLKNVAKSRKEKYLADMSKLDLDKITVNPLDIKQLVIGATQDFSRTTKKGPFAAKKTQAKIKEVNKLVDDWMASPELHTIDGLDFLKQSLDDLIPDAVDKGRAGAFVLNVQAKIKNKILDQSPEYADVMNAYSNSKILEKQIIKALGSNDITAIESIARKLQSTTRNNASTSYGLRGNLLDEIADIGGQPNLPFELAGQAADTFSPRGIPRSISGGVGATATGYGALTGNPALIGLGLMNTATSSPRLLGELAIQSGRAANTLSPALEALMKANQQFSSTYAPILRSSRLVGSTPVNESSSISDKEKILEKYKLK